MKGKKNTRLIVMIVILLGLLIIAYRTIFVKEAVDTTAEANVEASARVEAILHQVEGISFDISLLSDPKLESLRNIQMPLPSIPIGKKNPFTSQGVPK